MKIKISNHKGKEFEIELMYSREHIYLEERNFPEDYKINIDVMYEVDKFIYVKRFEKIINNEKFYYEINNLKSYESKQSKYHKEIFDADIEQQIVESLESLIKF